LVTALTIDTTSGPDTTTNTAMQNGAWEKDYYTSSRPWEQKGPAITVPLGTTAPVLRTNNAAQWDVTVAGSNTRVTTAQTLITQVADPNLRVTGTQNIAFDPKGGLYTDLSGASAVTVNVLREALALQRYEEARARYGSRYTEYLQYLGIRSSDARLQRPEYLGGGKQVIQFSEVLQTGVTTSGTPATGVGSLLGHGIGATRSNRYRRFFEEHGVILSLMSVLPKTVYVNGTSKHLIKTTKEDYWQKELQHIGQQSIANKETYAAHATHEGIFGYQDRYDDYRRIESGVSGEFRTILNYWHLARDFGSEPALNASFVSCVPTMRTFASAITDPFYVMANYSIQARRLVARSGKSFIF